VLRGVAGWQPGHPGPTPGDVPSFGVSYRRPELIPPLKLRPHPQSCAVSTPRPMKAAGACKLAAPAPAFAAEPLRPNTTWHASELHVHSRSCESPVRARVRALAREFAQDREAVLRPRDRRNNPPPTRARFLSARPSFNGFFSGSSRPPLFTLLCSTLHLSFSVPAPRRVLRRVLCKRPATDRCRTLLQ